LSVRVERARAGFVHGGLKETGAQWGKAAQGVKLFGPSEWLDAGCG